MNSLINLLKDRQIGQWCKRAAWIVLLIGLVQDFCNVLVSVQLNNQVLANEQPLATHAQQLSIFLANLPSVIFYFFILYAVGAVVHHTLGEQAENDKIEEGSSDDLNDEELDDNELTPEQMPGHRS